MAEMIADNMRGFGLTDAPAADDQSTATSAGTRRMKSAKWIPVAKIQADPAQPRKNFDQTSLAELAQSIKEYGIRQPIAVEYLKESDDFRIVSGERRYRAAQIIGLTELPCIIQAKADKAVRFAHQLIENIQREDFSPIDKARALLEYKSILGTESTWSEVEQKVGVSATRRKQFVALLNLPAAIQGEIVSIGKRPAKNQISEKHARALLLLNKLPQQQAELFNLIKQGKNPITGDEAIAKAKEMKGTPTRRIFRISYQSQAELIEKLQHALAELKKPKASAESPR